MTSLLEERYRRVLRMLPADFRRDWADDMVATFLDRAYRSRPDDPEGVEISSPRWPEVASVAGQAIRLRLGEGPGAPARAYVTGAALRRFALAGVLVHVALALSGVLLAVWWTSRLTGSEVGFTTWWQSISLLAGLLWIPAYVGLLYGRVRIAAVLVALALAPELIHRPTLFGAAWLLVTGAPLVALVAFHRGAPPVRARPWLIAVPVLTAALAAAVLIMPPSFSVVDLVTVGVVLAGLIALVAAAQQPATLVAAALWCLLVLPLRLTALYGPARIAELVALLVVGGAAAAMAWRAEKENEKGRAGDQGWERADASA